MHINKDLEQESFALISEVDSGRVVRISSKSRFYLGVATLEDFFVAT